MTEILCLDTIVRPAGGTDENVKKSRLAKAR